MNPMLDIDQRIIGFTNEIKWRLTSYFWGPSKDGAYYTADGKGHIRILLFSRANKLELFRNIVCGTIKSCAIWDDTFDALTDTELINLLRCPEPIWYDFDEDKYGEYTYSILKKEKWPKYYLDEFTGPIDEIDYNNDPCLD